MKSVIELRQVTFDSIGVEPKEIVRSLNDSEASDLVAEIFEQHGVEVFKCVAEYVIEEFHVEEES